MVLTVKFALIVAGLDVMRILPVVYDQINDEWITDKIRFSYDAFEKTTFIKSVS